MKCEEIQALEGAYLDSELDAAATAEVAGHLKSCPECARLFAEQGEFNSWLKAALGNGERSPQLWDRAERAVRSAAGEQPRSKAAHHQHALGPWDYVNRLAGAMGQVGTHRGRLVWASLGVVWLTILVLNQSARGPAIPAVIQPSPSFAALRFALTQKHRLMADLSVGSEPSTESKAPASHSRSEGRRETINT